LHGHQLRVCSHAPSRLVQERDSTKLAKTVAVTISTGSDTVMMKRS
jgi:hypothetical protein